MILKKQFLLFIFVFLFFSCKFNDDSVVNENLNSANKKTWTFIIYMSADNSLEASALADFNELENAIIPKNSKVLVLLDRAEGFDATNEDWTDTRLFEIIHEKKSTNKIVSKRISCEELGLSSNSNSELNMADKNTLASLLKFAIRKYKTDEYALIVWGHGTGWRNNNFSTSENIGGYKAFAIDEGNYMTISNLRQAIEFGMNGKKLAFLGFDTCFGTCLESAYELKDCAKIMAGTSSIEPESGWNYELFFSELKEDFSSLDIAKSAENQFRRLYKNYIDATFCVLNLENCETSVLAFNDFCATAASKIDSYAKRDDFISIFQDKCISYKALGFPCDFYVDSKDLVKKIASYDEILSEKANKVNELFDDFILSSWSSRNNYCSPGVFYSVFYSDGVVSNHHPELYFNGTNSPDVSMFVSNCSGYVPSKNNKQSLLDKIFYTFF